MSDVHKTEMRPLSELQSSGVLWLINRVCFHPRGFALALDVQEDGSVTGWQLWGNGDEPWSFGDDEDELFEAVEALMESVRKQGSDA